MTIRFGKMQNVIDFTVVLHFVVTRELRRFLRRLIFVVIVAWCLEVIWCYAVIRSNKNFHDPRKCLGTFDGQYRFPNHFGDALYWHFRRKCMHFQSGKENYTDQWLGFLTTMEVHSFSTN